MDMYIQAQDLEEQLVILRQQSYQLDLELDKFVDIIQHEGDFQEIVNTMIFLSHFIDTKLYRVVNFPPLKLANYKWQPYIKHDGDRVEDRIFDLNCNSPLHLIFHKSHPHKPRTDLQASELAAMISGASVVKEVLNQFNRQFSTGAGPVINKIIETHAWLTRAGKTLQIMLETLVETFRQKKELHFELITQLNELNGITQDFETYSKTTDMSFLSRYDEFLSEGKFSPETLLMQAHPYIAQRRSSAISAVASGSQPNPQSGGQDDPQKSSLGII